MDKKEIIALLNEDLEGEHGAIIQYLSHAYGMGEGEMSCEIEALAREEMRHLDWLAETSRRTGRHPQPDAGEYAHGRPGGVGMDGQRRIAGRRRHQPL